MVSNLACDKFPKFSTQPRTPKEIHKVQKRKGREEIGVIWGRKKSVKRGESNQTSSHIPK